MLFVLEGRGLLLYDIICLYKISLRLFRVDPKVKTQKWGQLRCIFAFL